MKQVQLTHKETQLIFWALTKKMGYKKSELLSETTGIVINNLLKDDFVRFSICYHLNKLDSKKIEKFELTDAIKSLNARFEYEEVI